MAYLVPDLDAAVAFWARHMGVGPFFKIPHIEFSESVYRGEPVTVDLSIALAWNGYVQIELMQQHSDAASVFSDFAPREGGFHHVGIRTADLENDSARLLAAGLTLLQRNISSTGTRTWFFGEAGTGIIELISMPGNASPIADKLKQAARDWDGQTLYL